MPAIVANTYSMLHRWLRHGAFVALFFATTAAAQVPANDSVYTIVKDSAFTKPGAEPADTADDIIRTFEEFNLPPEMLAHFGQITPGDAVTLYDEFQVTQNDEDGIPEVITVKLWFENDHLVGDIVEAPIDKTNKLTVSKFTVNIPIQWICTPATPDHQQHYVGSLSGIKVAEAQYKCQGWHIKLPEPAHADAPEKRNNKVKKEKRPKKGSKPPPAP